MIFGLTRGELLLVAFIFGLIYAAGLLPKIAARLVGGNHGTPVSGRRGSAEGGTRDGGAAAKPKGE